MPNLSDIAKAAEEYYQKGNFKPDVLPGCANFVSHCLQKAGSNLGIISYVPHLVDRCEVIPSTSFQPGDLVVFKQTYDAVAPAGIGAEDNMTHIGVIVNGGFIDFGGSLASVRKQALTGYWRDHIDFFMRPPGFEGSKPASKDPIFKLFFRPGINRIKAVIGDVNEELEDFILHGRTVNGNIVSIMHVENAPVATFHFGSLNGKVVAMDGKGWKVEVSD